MTKPQQVIAMLERATAAGVPFRYFATDAGYGRDPGLRDWCHDHTVAYVMAVPVDLPLLDARGRPTRPGRLLAGLDRTVWERRSCGQGTKGERWYDQTAVAVRVTNQQPSDGFTHTLLVRRAVGKPTEIEYFLAHAPVHTAVPELIAVAGMRWKIEENNEQGKDLLGLNEYQVHGSCSPSRRPRSLTASSPSSRRRSRKPSSARFGYRTQQVTGQVPVLVHGVSA